MMRRVCRSCRNTRRPDALAGGHAAPEDACDCEGRGLMADRICSARCILSPCGLSPTSCCDAASMDVKGRGFLLLLLCTYR